MACLACSFSLKNRSHEYFQPAGLPAWKALTGLHDVTNGTFCCSAASAPGMTTGGVQAPRTATTESCRTSSRTCWVVVLGSLRLSRTFSCTWRLVPPTSRPPAALTSDTSCS